MKRPSASTTTHTAIVDALRIAVQFNGQTMSRNLVTGDMQQNGTTLLDQSTISALLDDGMIDVDIRDRYEEGDGAEISVGITADGRKHLAIQLCIEAMSIADPDGDDFDDIFESVAAYFDPENWS